MPDQAETYLQHLDPLHPIISYTGDLMAVFFIPSLSVLQSIIFCSTNNELLEKRIGKIDL